jgi:hypothetical protein
MTHRFVSNLCTGTLVLASSLANLCFAQTPTGQKSRVQVIRVKPEMLDEFVDLQKNEVVPALKKGGTKTRTVYQTALFGNATEFAIVTPFDKFAEFDGESPQLKALGATANARLGEKIRKCVQSADSFLITQEVDLSNNFQTSTPPPMIVTTRIRVAPGKMQDFENLVKNEITPGFKKEKLAFVVNRRGTGANPNDISFTTPLARYAEMDLGSAAVRALGQDTVTKLGPRFNAVATIIETVVRRRVPELSF